MTKPLLKLLASALFTMSSVGFAQDAPPPYELPKQELTYEITLRTLLADMSLSRGKITDAYGGYMILAQKTRDPRYAEMAYKVAALVNEPQAAIAAAELLKQLAPNAIVGQDLVNLNKIQAAYQHIDRQEYRPAYDAAKEILSKEPNNTAALSLLADVADRLGYADEALSASKQWLKIEPNNPEAQNAHGYALADKNLRLRQAEKLIQKALAQKPDAPHIMDSMGWLLYRQGRLNEALPLLTQAATLQPDGVILVHLGEVLWHNNEKSKALQAFQKAYALNAYSSTLRDTLERLNIPLHDVQTGKK